MPINFRYSQAIISNYFMELPVTIEGRSLRVGAGVFRVNSQEYELLEDTDWDVPRNRPHGLTVIGMLVQDKDTQEVELIIDEVWNSGGDALYEFGPSDPFLALAELFSFHIKPEDGDNLNKIDIMVRRSKEPPPRPPAPESVPLSFPEED
jgi:hypothetical protein